MTCMLMRREILKVVGLDMGQVTSILMARIVNTSLSGMANLKERVEGRAFSIPHSLFKNIAGVVILLHLTLVALAFWDIICHIFLDMQRLAKEIRIHLEVLVAHREEPKVVLGMTNHHSTLFKFKCWTPRNLNRKL